MKNKENFILKLRKNSKTFSFIFGAFFKNLFLIFHHFFLQFFLGKTEFSDFHLFFCSTNLFFFYIAIIFPKQSTKKEQNQGKLKLIKLKP